MSLWGLQVVENAFVPLDELYCVMPLGGSFPKPDGFDEWSAMERLLYAVEQGAIVVVHPASNPFRPEKLRAVK